MHLQHSEKKKGPPLWKIAVFQSQACSVLVWYLALSGPRLATSKHPAPVEPEWHQRLLQLVVRRTNKSEDFFSGATVASAGLFSSADTVVELSRSGVGGFLFVVPRYIRYNSRRGSGVYKAEAIKVFSTVRIPFIAAERRRTSQQIVQSSSMCVRNNLLAIDQLVGRSIPSAITPPPHPTPHTATHPTPRRPALL